MKTNNKIMIHLKQCRQDKRLGSLLAIAAFWLFTMPAAGQMQWRMLSEMPTPVAGGRAVVYDSLIYIIGGYTNPGDITASATNLVQIYDPAQDTWQSLVVSPVGRAGFVAGVYDEQVYFAGGVWNFVGNPFVFSVERWDFSSPATNFYNFHLQFNRINATGIVHDGKLVLVGGQPLGIDTLSLSYIAVFDLATSTFVHEEDSLFAGQPLPTQQMVSLVGDDLFIFGGVRFGISQRVYRFNIATFEFEEVHQLNRERAGAASLTADDHDVYLIGGFNESPHQTALDSVTIYATDNPGNPIHNAPNMNHRRKDLMAVQFGNSIYVFGGINEYNQTVTAVERMDILTGITQDNDLQPQTFELLANYPNPFNNSTTLQYRLDRPAEVELAIFNALGQRIATLVQETQAAGEYTRRWDGRDDFGNTVGSGVYLARLSAGNNSKTLKMVLLK